MNKKLWLLRPIKDHPLWDPWYDTAFGFVVCAETEEEARYLASEGAGDEGSQAWLLSGRSTCEVLTPEIETGVVICDWKDD